MNITDNKINIIQIIPTLLRGGAELLLLDLAKNLDRNRYNISILSFKGGPLEKDFEEQGIEMEIIGKKNKLEILWQIYKYLKNKKPQIVHTHLFGADTWGRIAAIKARVPVIITTEHNINLSEGYFKRLIKKFLSLFADRIIAVSEGVKEYSIEEEGINPDKIEVIYNGIDLNNFPFRGSKEISLENIKAGVIARLREQKGHIFLIRALPQIINKYPGFRLKIIGGGELESGLKEAVSRLNLNKYVEFFGDRQDILQILNELDLFILPSLWEGLGMSVLEAQAVGVPVLVSNTGGLKEIVRDKINGVLFEPGDSGSIFEAIDWALRNKAELPKIVSAGRKNVEDNFDLRQKIKKYEEVYQELTLRKYEKLRKLLN
jgi:glycosyltransferase involved in cell wall biosynthesis